MNHTLIQKTLPYGMVRYITKISPPEPGGLKCDS